MNAVDWYGCYDGSWSSAPLVPEAYAHPAKCSFALAERIYRHMLAEGWLQPGDTVTVTQDLLNEITRELEIDNIAYR